MKKNNSRFQGMWSIIIIYFLIATPFFVSCSGSGGGGNDTQQNGNNTSGGTINASLGTSFNNVPIVANQPTQHNITYTLPGNITGFKDFSVNLDETMKNVTVSSSQVVTKFNIFDMLKMFARLDVAAAVLNATVTVRLSYAGDSMVCTNPNAIQLGPYSFSGDVDGSVSSSSSSESPNTTTFDVVNSGTFQLCLVISPLPVDAYLTVSDVVVDVTPCDLQPPADEDVLGNWTGTYDCDNWGTSDSVHETINLIISKNPDGSYHYEDFDQFGGTPEGIYDGHFCGNTFKFKGGQQNIYTESGTFVLQGRGAATKTSTWNTIPPGFEGGYCTDSLNKL